MKLRDFFQKQMSTHFSAFELSQTLLFLSDPQNEGLEPDALWSSRSVGVERWQSSIILFCTLAAGFYLQLTAQNVTNHAAQTLCVDMKDPLESGLFHVLLTPSSQSVAVRL